MKSLKYYNQQLYVTKAGNVWAIRQVGEYMYQVKDLNRNRLLGDGRLYTIEQVKYLFCGIEVYKVKDLIGFYDLYIRLDKKEQNQ